MKRLVEGHFYSLSISNMSMYLQLRCALMVAIPRLVVTIELILAPVEPEIK